MPLLSRASRRASLSLVGAVSFLALCGVASAAVLATVNGTPITDDDVKIAIADLGSNLPEGVEGAERDKYVLDYLVDLKLVAAKSEADKLISDADLQRSLAYFRQKIAMEALLTKVAKDATTDQALHKLYDDAAARQPPETEVHARHILLPTEDEAKAAEKRVKAGEDFGKVADELSKDPGSQGGDLGWFTKDKMVPEFADAAFKMKPGEVSDPVKSQFGWHVIKLEETRQKQFPAFDTVKDQINRYVVQKAQSDLISQLRGQAQIVRNDTPPAAPPTAPGAVPAPTAPAPVAK